MTQSTPDLCKSVQHNCNIADARNAGDYTLCVYLLKMREYFRWERGYSCAAKLPQEEIGQWLREREDLWESLEDQDFQKLSIDQTEIDPFDSESINRLLVAKGQVYSAGYGANGKPHFFLGTLERRESFNGHTILVAADECARDLTAPPAMSLFDTIFIRRESLRRFLWEKVQEWRWNEHPNAMARALAHYPFDEDLEKALDLMTDHELEAVLLHEIGEIQAEHELGPNWRNLLAQLPRSRSELLLRAVRDHLADAISTLPELIRREDEASLHFYMANLSAIRKDLFPSFVVAYEEWRNSGNLNALRSLMPKAKSHWSGLARRVLKIEPSQDFGKKLQCLVESATL